MDYNMYMAGVDKVSQLIQYQSMNRKTKKWYRKLLMHLMDIGLNNSFILYEKFG